MANITRWLDTECKVLQDAINTIKGISERECESDVTRYCNWKIEKEFNEAKKIELNNNNIEYSYCSISFDTIRPGEEPVEDRTTHNKCFVIVYFSGSNVNYIIDRNSDAKTILRKLLNYSGKNEIKENNFNINSDLFIWLISKVYYNENILESSVKDESNIVLRSIKGFKGDSEDYLTKVTASGESVIKIISSLSFILESRNINQIKIEIDYGQNKGIEVELNVKSFIKLDISNYIGEYLLENEEETLVKLYLLFYLEIFPKIIQLYQNEKEAELWNKEGNIKFLEDVAKALTESIELKLDILKKD
ncbi:hypothetical protein QYB58_000261 [Clostridium perfringens]|nr:hypothetical protein [Clostridium perfringens]